MKNQKILYKIKHMFEEDKIQFKTDDDKKHFEELIHAFEHHIKMDVDVVKDDEDPTI